MTSPQPLARVLIVDDRPRVRFDLRQLLELSGKIEVAGEAGSGREAVQQTAALHPDVVLMDLELPGLDGCQAARLIKAQNLAGRIIFLSIYAGAEDVQRARQAGADAYLVKGCPFEELLAVILGPG